MKKDSFIKGASMATICIFISKILGIIYVIPFYSIIGEQGGALYGYAYNIYSIFLAISTAGIPTAVSKLTSEYDALKKEEGKKHVYKESVKIISFLCLVTFIILVIFAPQIGYLIIGSSTGGNSIKDIAFIIRAISVALLIVPILSVARGYLQGEKYITSTAKSEIIEQIFRIAILLLGSYVIIKVMNQSITLGVAVSLLGASLGGLAAYIYLKVVMKKNKINVKPKKAEISETKEIRSKIIKYAIPFIVVSVVLAVYNFSDMVVTLRVLIDLLKYPTVEAERIIALYTTWGEKFQRIIAGIATGVGISLIPNIVRAYVKKEYKEVQNILIKAIEMVTFICLPLCILISIFAKETWFIFYDFNLEGSLIIAYSIFIGLLASLSTITTTALQSINKYKYVYFSVIVGMLLNILLDTPLILFMDYIGAHPCYGSITASMIGFSTTILMSLYYFKKECNIKYKVMLKNIGKLLISIITLVFFAYILKIILPVSKYESKFIVIIYNCIYFGTSLLMYIFVSYRTKLLQNIFGEDKIRKILKK